MKRILLLLMIGIFASQMLPYEKLSLVERFTNASCVPCASINNSWYNVTTQELVNDGLIAHIIYNGWWPGSNDPMYLLNQPDNTTRINYYGVNAVPWIVVNGSTISTSQSSLVTAVENGNSNYSPFLLSIIQEELTSSLIKYKVLIIRDPNDNSTFSNIKLRFALTEKTVAFPSPPGANGESTFYSVCRKMLPDAGGTLFTIPAPGESTEISLEYTPTSQFLAAVNLDSIRAVAFIQSDTDKYIYQSLMGENYSAIVLNTSSDIIASNTSSANFSTSIFNSGLLTDSYAVQALFDGPVGWFGEYTTENGTFPFGQSDVVEVEAGSTSDVSVNVGLNGINGFGEILIQFTSTHDPEKVVESKMRLVTVTGVDGLVIDASGEGYGDVLIPGMDEAFDYTYGIISSEALYPSIDLTDFTLICWSMGDAFPVFTQDDVNALTPFLDDGGRLLINGQDIGQDIFDANGQSQFAQSFYNNYLHANYVAEWGQSYFMVGMDGDPITNQISFPLSNLYLRSPDQISAYDTYGTPILKFGVTQNYNSLRADDGNDRVVYLGFGLEQIADQAIRDTIVTRSINWLMNGVVLGTPNEDFIVKSFNLEQNYPNPFNPSTTISYTIPNESQVSLVVYDIMGRQVAELVNSKQPAGAYNVYFEAASLASGTYFYKLTAGEFISVKKMILLK